VCYNPWREGEIMKGGKEFRIGIAVVALAITIAICMGGYHLYMEYGVKKPLTESLLQVYGVQNVEIQDEQEELVITLTLVNDADLKTVFREANRLASLEMEDKKYCIEVADNPSPELSSLYNDLELGLYQGIANSSFIWLTQWINDYTAPHHTEYRIQVDDENLYLMLSKGNHYLARVIKRNIGVEKDGRVDVDA
jgi:hypothetical protein